jgi:deoxyribonuclease V
VAVVGNESTLRTMLACVDAEYQSTEGPAVASCVVYERCDSAGSREERVVVIPRVAPYKPGQFYERELPCILKVLEEVQTPIDIVIVDAYVWLDEEETPGLGAHLHRALRGRVAVIGVAKEPFGDYQGQRRVVRGGSQKPLFITGVGIDVDVAAKCVQRMHGAHRVPTLLRRADQLCRTKPFK